MHPYSNGSWANPKLIGFLALAGFGVSAVIGLIVGWMKDNWGWSFGGVSTLGAFGGLYFLFDHWLWKWKLVRRVLLVPDLNGVWKCDGQTVYKNAAPADIQWAATIRIRQSWSKIAIMLKTAQSASASIAASIDQEGDGSYRLIYQYENEPKASERDMARHSGACKLTLSALCDSASGSYFTDRDRMTVGTMQWHREGSPK